MLKKLEWDSNFFDFNIARMECRNMTEQQFDDEINTAREEGIELIYCFCYDQTSKDFAKKYGDLVDRKVTYHKVFNENELEPTNILIEEYTNEEPTEELYDLAIKSGIYSRFNVDEKLPKDKFESMYRTWIRKSTLKEMAFKVLVAKENGCLAGMVTLGEKNGRGDIGLLAVDSNFRGKGIGKSLVKAAEKEFIKSFKEGQVVTQEDNIPACSLYEKCGYSVEKAEPIYHIWL